MCVIVLKSEDKQFNKQDLKDCFKSNRNGAGFAYPSDGRVEIEKGFFNFKELWKALLPLENKPVMLHFRLATSGLTDDENCHPFEVASTVAMAHNGVLSQFEFDGEHRSDTAVLVEEVLRPVFDRWPKFYRTDEGKNWLEYLAPDWNKLAFINARGDFYKTNTSAWHNRKGLSYSNLTWLHKQYQVASPYFSQAWVNTPEKSKGGSAFNKAWNYIYDRNEKGEDIAIATDEDVALLDSGEPIAMEYVNNIYCMDCVNLCFGEPEDLIKQGATPILFEEQVGYKCDCVVCDAVIAYGDLVANK